MAPPTSINGDNDTHDVQTESGFAMQWQPTDTSSLQPANLSLTRAPRAWERKPLSPFSRQKMRVGKVWKRPAPVEIRKRRSVGVAGGKPVKKMRLDGGGAVSVARWEGEGEDEDGEGGSPVRKIVLRGDRVGEEGLAALPDEEDEGVEQANEEDGIVEVLDEDGTLLDVDPEDVEEQREWEDEEEFNPTMMHLGDIVERAQQQARAGAHKEALEQEEPEAAELPSTPDYESTPIVDSTQLEAATFTEPTPTLTAPEQVVLPEGFVSPVKQQAAPARKSARKSYGSRRRTLPTEWRPSRLRQVENVDDVEDGDEPTPAEPVAVAEVDSVSNDAEPTRHVDGTEDMVEQGADQEWEDVEDEPHAIDANMNDAFADEQTGDKVDLSPSQSASEPAMNAEEESGIEPSDGFEAASMRPTSPTKLPSSPVPSIEGQHPRLPLRRSPRRKSSSPVKRSAIRPSTEKPHLLAFTPIKELQHFSAFTASPISGDQSTEDDMEDIAAPLERSVSAPPEEPTMSPHRPARPRVSDDTALLQAFLNRAAETKSSGRRMSATKRESIENRRESGAVRQALASPAKPEVLADLDPNSPSPRKTTIVSDEIDDANIIPDPEPFPSQNTRRSGRATRKAAPQTATPAAAPNKISIRGNSDGVVLKKSEAQELSQMTRTNTRKNKGGSVLPLYRLAKLQQQGISDPLDDGTVIEEEVVSKPNSKGRALRWNETLVEFWQGGDVSETSMLSDELSASAPAPSAADEMEVEVDVPATALAPPPPAETPSKPKIRRLKAPRTAAAPGKATPATADSAVKSDIVDQAESAAPQTKAAAATKRRSRIATPAKGLGNSSLLPADLEPTPAPASAPQQQPKKTIPAPNTSTGRRKAPVSKLPAPATAPTAALSTSTSLATSQPAPGQGKENLISSPPKKKPASTGNTFNTSANGLPSAKTFAPKLDFGKSTSLAPNSASFNSGSQEDGLPGLASPAKKVGRRGVMFAPSMSNGAESQEESKEEVPLGLRSPAKKRTRRAVGGL